MNWRYLNLLSGSLIFVCIFLPYASSYGQSGCGCPLSGQCSPCSGGISELTLAYHGVIPLAVTVKDNALTAFSAVLYPGQNFTVIGQAGGKFYSNDVDLYVVGIWNAQIDVTCGLGFDPSTNYGWFTIVSAKSKNNGPLCCSSNNGANNPPTIFGCPTDIQVVAGSTCSMPVSWIAPQADQCDATFTVSHPPGTVFPLGTTTVTYTATNSNNKSSTCSFNVTVIDNTSPVLVSGTPPISLNADATCKAVATWIAPTFSDNCTSVPLITSSHTSGSIFPVGRTDVTYTAKDATGNATVYNFSVTVNDVVAPTVTNCPADLVLAVTGNCNAKATWTPPAFTDACTSVTVTSSHNPGTDFPVGTTEVTYTAVDNANNATQCKFNVIVNDQVKPIISACPSDISLTTSTLPGVLEVDWTLPTAVDDCALASLVGSHEPGATFPIGTTTVTYTATDISGNTSLCSFNVTIGWENDPLIIGQLLTPDGNTVNDEWEIVNIEKYENNKVIIVDRWGNVVYSATRYHNERNVWKGENGNGNLVPTGTYFYTISIHSGPSVFEKKGFIEVVR